jgi:hypothetical protein
MSKHPPIEYKGRIFGILALVVAQLFIGVIHAFSGLLLLGFENWGALKATAAYDFYTLAFGVLILVFTWFIWRGKKAGWIGTVAVLIFVAVVDSLTVLNLPSVPGTPTFPAATEIGYSILVIAYLSTSRVRKKFFPAA